MCPVCYVLCSPALMTHGPFFIICMVFPSLCAQPLPFSCLVHSLYCLSCCSALNNNRPLLPCSFLYKLLLPRPLFLLFSFHHPFLLLSPPFVLSLFVTPSSSSPSPLPTPTPFLLCFLVSLFSLFTSVFNPFSYCYLPMLTN